MVEALHAEVRLMNGSILDGYLVSRRSAIDDWSKAGRLTSNPHPS